VYSKFAGYEGQEAPGRRGATRRPTEACSGHAAGREQGATMHAGMHPEPQSAFFRIHPLRLGRGIGPASPDFLDFCDAPRQLDFGFGVVVEHRGSAHAGMVNPPNPPLVPAFYWLAHSQPLSGSGGAHPCTKREVPAWPRRGSPLGHKMATKAKNAHPAFQLSARFSCSRGGRISVPGFGSNPAPKSDQGPVLAH